MHTDAIVILGYSDVGKDSAFAALDKRNPNKFTNVKFGAYAKLLTAKAFDISPQVLEDKNKRNETNEYGLSPMDMLTALFKGCDSSLTKAHIAYAFNSIQPQLIPVFTDVRRSVEADAIDKSFVSPLYIWLVSPSVEPSVNDTEIMSIARNHFAYIIVRITPDLTAETIEVLTNA